ncbi:DUF2790 domain-containing protein [Pseudomonas sp. MIL19]|uniref:DUF2790 domain-containing protein n=1 Tax=Pseudomonas TaxID=286 RepID=UPI0023649C8F|nr:DUF2790 domain-containing protein [Pseudomonas sp. MIL19]MDD2162666.1 DUF2790 domain-containing protein [Pseudomonas sp. MIL19]
MNLNNTLTASLFVLLSLGVPPVVAQENIVTETYSYNTPLDINSVVSLTEDSSQHCNVVNAQMTYLKSNGEKRVLIYRKLSSNCSDGG